MNAQLIKVDVAAMLLGRSARNVLELIEGGDLDEPGFEWVFDLANNPDGYRSDPRFWYPEIAARAAGSNAAPLPTTIDGVINTILPERRQAFQAGELDMLFQIRPTTRIALHAQIVGQMKNGINFYGRNTLVEFLKRRWLGRNLSPAAKSI